jgi:hypothetical protein
MARCFAVLLAFAACACSVPAGNDTAEQRPVPQFSNYRIIAEPEYPTPDSFSNGKFITVGSCLLLETESGRRFNPVFPHGTEVTVAPDGKVAISFSGRVVNQGNVVPLKGGSGEYGQVGSLDSSCAEKNFIVGGLRDQDI